MHTHKYDNIKNNGVHVIKIIAAWDWINSNFDTSLCFRIICNIFIIKQYINEHMLIIPTAFDILKRWINEVMQNNFSTVDNPAYGAPMSSNDLQQLEAHHLSSAPTRSVDANADQTEIVPDVCYI